VQYSCGSNHKQNGQVMPLTLGIIAIACVTFLLMFNSSRAVNEKINLVNAADASAYSGAQIAARHLNFMAYTNRAMIANEAAIGHLYSFQVETQIVGNVIQEGVSGGGPLVNFIIWFIDLFWNGAIQDSLDFIAAVAQPLVDGSKVVTGMLTLMLDANNATFSNFQQQAYQDLIQVDPATGMTIVDQTMGVVASSYIDRGTAPIRVNDPDTLYLFEGSDDPQVSNSAREAGSTAQTLCEMILFARPGVESGNPLGTAFGARSQSCSMLVSGGSSTGSVPGSSLQPEADGGLMIDAIRQTVNEMDNGTWIRDRNVNNYSLGMGGLLRGSRTGQTQIEYNAGTDQLNWVAADDSLSLRLAGVQILRTSESGDAALNVEEATSLVDDAAIQGLRLLGLCGDDDAAVDCNELANESYDSIQRYAALDPNRRRATVTAFLSQDNCSDGIGFDESGVRKEGWSDGLQRFEDKEQFCGKNVYAIGKAEVYFQRPDCYQEGNTTCSPNDSGFSRLNGGAVEVPNLFNPFWHARLVATGGGG